MNTHQDSRHMRAFDVPLALLVDEYICPLLQLGCPQHSKNGHTPFCISESPTRLCTRVCLVTVLGKMFSNVVNVREQGRAGLVVVVACVLLVG